MFILNLKKGKNRLMTSLTIQNYGYYVVSSSAKTLSINLSCYDEIILEKMQNCGSLLVFEPKRDIQLTETIEIKLLR